MDIGTGWTIVLHTFALIFDNLVPSFAEAVISVIIIFFVQISIFSNIIYSNIINISYIVIW